MGILKNLLVTGSARFVNIIKGTVQKSQNGAFYGACATAAATAEKVVTLTDGAEFELVSGVIIGVKFSYTNTADNAKLNVNSTGAKSIWYNTAVYTAHNTNVTGVANRISYYMYDGTNWVFLNNSNNATNNSYNYPAAQCDTAAATAAKAANCTSYTLTANTYLHFNIQYANTSKTALTINVNSRGAKPIYINGTASSATNYTLPAGSYIAFYDGTNWYFRTDGKLPADISGDAATVNEHTVAADVPLGAIFTDTKILSEMTGTLGVDHGGTGATSAADARTNLGLGTASTYGVETTVANDTNLTTGSAVTALKNSLTVDGVNFYSGTTIIHYGESTTAAGTAAKVVACSNFSRVAGAVIYVRFAYANTASAPTLNVNNTGAANIRYRNANISSTYIVANEVYCFVYDGAYYQLVGDVDTAATTAQIQSAVDTWLNQHTSSSTIVYSSSLTHTVVKTATDISW